VGVIKNQQN